MTEIDRIKAGFGIKCACSWSSKVHINGCPEHGDKGMKVITIDALYIMLKKLRK